MQSGPSAGPSLQPARQLGGLKLNYSQSVWRKYILTDEQSYNKTRRPLKTVAQFGTHPSEFSHLFGAPGSGVLISVLEFERRSSVLVNLRRRSNYEMFASPKLKFEDLTPSQWRCGQRCRQTGIGRRILTGLLVEVV